MADVIEINSEEILDIDGAENDNQDADITEKKTPKSLKKRSIFRKSKIMVSEEIGESSKETSEAPDSNTPPAIKISCRRFGFVKKDRKPMVENEPEQVNLETKEAAPIGHEDNGEIITEKASDIEILLTDRVYTGPEKEEGAIDNETVMEQDDSNMEDTPDHENSETNQYDDGEPNETSPAKEDGQKKMVSRIPLRKARKLHWKRISRDRAAEIPDTKADEKESQEEIERSETDVANEATLEESENVVEKKPSKTRRLLKWKRQATEPKSNEEDAQDANEDEHQVTVEEITAQESGDTENATEKKVTKPRRLLKWRRSGKAIESVDTAAQTGKDGPENKEDSLIPDSKGAETTSNCHQEMKDEPKIETVDGDLEQTNENKHQDDDLGKRRSRKSRISWKRFGHWHVKSVETQSPPSWDDDQQQQEEEPAARDETPDENAKSPERESEATPTEETAAVVTPIESESGFSEKTVEENTLEQSDLTHVTQLIDIPEDNAAQLTIRNSFKNPFLGDEGDDNEIAGETSETSNLLEDAEESKSTEDANKTLDFVLVDKFSNKPRDESFYLTKKALKVYKKAHLTQHYCQPCCTVM